MKTLKKEISFLLVLALLISSISFGFGGGILKTYAAEGQSYITFDANGGTGGSSALMTIGDTLTAPSVTKTNYTFLGWSPTIPATVPTADTTYTAIWFLSGDLNSDGTINYTDVAMIENYISGNSSLTDNQKLVADINKDGQITSLDSLLIEDFQNWMTLTFPTTPVVLALGTVPFTGSSVTGTQNSDIVISVNIAAGSMLAAADFRVMYDSTKLTYKSRALGSVTSGFFIGTNPNYSVNGDYVTANFGIVQTNSTGISAAGSILNLTFTVKSGWSGSTPLVLTIEDSYNNSYEFLTPVITNGSVTVPAVTQSTITFDANGGTGGTSTSMTSGSTLTAPTVTRTGYTFAGWSPTVPATVPSVDTTYTAQWTVNKYTISFNSNGGSAVTSISQNYGTTVTAPTNPTKTGYTFAGWSPVVPLTMPAANTNCVAQWTANQYIITFDANGGIGGTSQSLACGTSLTPPIVSRTGYTFLSWSPTVPAKVPTANTTYTAQWRETNPAITFVSNGGSTVAVITPGYNTSVSKPTDPVKDGFTFGGWFTGPELTTPVIWPFKVTQSVTFYAKWNTENFYTIIFDANGGTGGTISTMAAGDPFTAPTVTKTNYTFIGWSPTIPATVPAANTTYTAIWFLSGDLNSDGTINYTDVAMIENYISGNSSLTDTQKLVADINKDGQITSLDSLLIEDFQNWMTLTFPTTPVVLASGTVPFTVSSVTGTQNSDIVISVNIAAGSMLAAADFRVVYDSTKLTYKSRALGSVTSGFFIGTNPNYSVNGDYVTANFGIVQTNSTGISAAGSILNLTFTVKSGWTGSTPLVLTIEDSYNNSYELLTPVITNGSVTAIPSVNQSVISFDANGGTGGSITFMTIGAALTAPTVTRTGYTFAGWSPTVPATVPSVNTTYTAQWTVNKYTISFNSNGGSTVTDITQNLNTSVAKPADPTKTGYTFSGWYSDEELSTAVTWPYIFGAANVTFYAKWTVNSYAIIWDANGGTGGTSCSLTYGTQITNIPVVSRTGYTFVGWSPIPDTVPAADTTFTAQWSVNSYTITFDANGGTGTVPDSQTAVYGSSVDLPVQGNMIKQDYSFLGWAATADATVPLASFTVPVGNTSLYAVWSQNANLIASSGATTVFNSADNFIYGLKPGLTKADFESQYISINGNGKLVYTPDNGVLGTGTKVELIDNSTGAVLQTYTIVIFGDVNGDGNIDSIDAGVMVDVQNYATTWDPVANAYYYKAGDLNGDGNIDSIDAGLTVDFQNYMVNINQATGSVV